MEKWLLYISIYFLSTPFLFISTLYAQQFGLKRYNVNDGLPSTEVYGGYQDKYGYLWISSAAGLSRFDGRQFVNYSLEDGLPSLQVTNTFQDSKGRLWVGTAAGMAQFKNNKFVVFPTSDKLSDFYVFNFTETKNKKIWANTGAGAYEFRDSAWQKLSLYPGYENSMCRRTIELDGELYVNYPNDIFCKTKQGKWITVASLHNGDIFNEMSLENNKIWVNTNDNIYEIHNRKIVPLFKGGLGIEHFFSYFLDSKKRLWVTNENLVKISKSNDWQHFIDTGIELYGYASGISEDSRGNIWIGTAKGLLKIRDINFSTIDKNNLVPLDGIYNIIALSDNRLIFSSGTKTGWLIYENNHFKQIIPPSANDKNFFKDPVDAYTVDEKNSAWMITRFKKFLHFNGKALEDFSASVHFKTTEIIYDLNYVKSRRQFFICADSTLLSGSSLKLSTFIPRNTGIPVMKPVRVHETRNGLILLFISRKGLYCIDAANNLISLNKQTGIDSGSTGPLSAACFCDETNSNFWMAISGLGLYEYGFAKNQLPYLKNHLTVKNGLQSNNILSLTTDRQNRLWIMSNTGLDILQKNDADIPEVFNYASMDELTLSGSYYEKLATDVTGTVWLSSPNKILKFNTDNIHLYKERPGIVIEKVSLAFKETDWSRLADSVYNYYQLPYNPVLHYNQNSLAFSFNAVDISTLNSDMEYSYKLAPVDTSWSVPSKIKSVSFAQLPPAKYRFFVRAKDRASGWSAPAIFNFTISPPFWNQWWFRLTVIAIASYIVISIFRRRIKKIRRDAFMQTQLKELEMKALKAQMNPHFIYNALNSIQALIANDKKTEGIHYIGSFSRLLRQVLDNSENNVITLDKELETIDLYIQLEALRLDMQLRYKKIIPTNIVAEFEKIPPLILQPFVENALWHGLSRKEGKKEIKVTVSLNDSWLLCNITDNGIGRAKAQELKSQSLLLHQSKGINITRKRLNDFNEDDSVSPIEFLDLYDDDNTASGTCVIVRIKRKGGLPSV